ncbi:hypothetical protein [Bacteroides uniformis]
MQLYCKTTARLLQRHCNTIAVTLHKICSDVAVALLAFFIRIIRA